MSLSARSLRAFPRVLPRSIPRLRPFTTARLRRTPHVEYPASPTKSKSYASPLLPLPEPPTQPASSGLLLLYIPTPPPQWQSHIELSDPLVGSVSKAMALAGIRCIVAHDGDTQTYRAKLLVPGGLIASYQSFDQSTLDSPEFKQTVESLVAGRATGRPLGYSEVLVCTHGARDCRCSDIGGDLAIALRAELSRRGAQVMGPGEEPEGAKGGWKVTDCAHVGGHKWAANAILLPSLTFLSNLRPTHAPLIIDHLSDPSNETLKSQLWSTHFRGIIAASPESQLKAYESALAPASASASAAATATPLRKRLPIRFTTSDGEPHDVFGFPGESLMEIAKREGLGAIEGTCGGHLECATCHMYIPYKLIDDPAIAVSDLTDSEEDMLDYALGIREEQSRLGCQVLLSEGLSEWSLGGRGVELPEY